MWKYTREGHGASFSESSRNASTASLLKVSYPSLHALDDTEDMRGIRHKMLRKAPMEASELLPPGVLDALHSAFLHRRGACWGLRPNAT